MLRQAQDERLSGPSLALHGPFVVSLSTHERTYDGWAGSLWCVPPVANPSVTWLQKLSRVRNFSGEARGSHRRWRGEIDICIRVPHPPQEISVCRRDHIHPVSRDPSQGSDAWTASGHVEH